VQLPIWFSSAESIRQSSRARIAYDCHDYLSGFPNMAADIVAFEAEAIERADKAVFSSGWLRDRFVARGEQQGVKSRVIRNAVEPSFYGRAEAAGRPRNGMTAVYVGAIESWFDETLIAAAARLLPQCRFLLAGRVDERGVLSISSLPNVEFLGEISRAAIPSLLSEAAVGLIPFRITDLTLAANPLKLYEYFSAGLPVVSTSLPEVAAFGDLVYIANNGEEFAQAIECALNETDRSLKTRRIRVAESETWDQRVVEFLEMMGPAQGA
jgi:glycosyltransferase involved in cell wall biosynthesis